MITTLAATPAFLRAQAQTGAAEPGLKQRAADTDADNAPEQDISGLKRGRTALPQEAWGEYPLGEQGEVIELDVQDRRLDGYISRQGDGESDKGTALTYFFDRSTINGTQLTFRTKAVHGVRYSFAGEIARERDPQGAAFVLVGTLTEYSRAHGTQEPRRVSLRKRPAFGGER